MAEATCRRELELEIPAEEVTKKIESVAKEFARVANVPGFRRGKAPISLIRRKFADDIKGEVLQSLVPERVEKAVAEQKLTPVSQPQVDKLDFNEGQPLKFRDFIVAGSHDDLAAVVVRYAVRLAKFLRQAVAVHAHPRLERTRRVI